MLASALARGFSAAATLAGLFALLAAASACSGCVAGAADLAPGSALAREHMITPPSASGVLVHEILSRSQARHLHRDRLPANGAGWCDWIPSEYAGLLAANSAARRDRQRQRSAGGRRRQADGAVDEGAQGRARPVDPGHASIIADDDEERAELERSLPGRAKALPYPAAIATPARPTRCSSRACRAAQRHRAR